MRTRLIVAALSCGLLVALAPLALAASHGHAGMDHGKMDHGGMGMKGDKIPLGETVGQGVKARGMLKDIRQAMGEMGMDLTHHFMVFFSDAASGAALAEGRVAVKVTGPDGVVGQPVKLMGMGEGFGADVALDKPGSYQLEVGTKLQDGQQRSFNFSYSIQ